MDALHGRDRRRRAHPARPVELRGIVKHYGPHRAIDGLDLEIRAGEFITLLGPSGSGKTTTLMLIAGFEQPSAGEHPDRRPRGRAAAGVPAQHRHGVPELRPVPASDGGREHRLPARSSAAPSRAERDDAVTRMLDMVQLQGFERPLPAAALGRAAAAGGDRARDRVPPARPADGRAAERARQAAAGNAAARDQAAARAARHHLRLCHARPARGAGDVGPGQRDEPRPHRADRRAARRCTTRPPTASSPAFVGEANMLPVAGVARDGRPAGDPHGEGAVLRAPRAGLRARAASAWCGRRRCWCGRTGRGRRARTRCRPIVREVVFMGEMTRYALQTAAAASC